MQASRVDRRGNPSRRRSDSRPSILYEFGARPTPVTAGGWARERKEWKRTRDGTRWKVEGGAERQGESESLPRSREKGRKGERQRGRERESSHRPLDTDEETPTPIDSVDLGILPAAFAGVGGGGVCDSARSRSPPALPLPFSAPTPPNPPFLHPVSLSHCISLLRERERAFLPWFASLLFTLLLFLGSSVCLLPLSASSSSAGYESGIRDPPPFLLVRTYIHIYIYVGECRTYVQYILDLFIAYVYSLFPRETLPELALTSWPGM